MTATNSAENTFNIHQYNLRMKTRALIEAKTMGQARLTDAQHAVIASICEWLCGGLKQKSGILLIGDIGTGKTTIMQATVAYYSFLKAIVIPEYHADMLPGEIKKRGIDYFYKRPIFFDDLGKEPPETIVFGQRYDTWVDIFSIRYEFRAKTFATGNYHLASYAELYGKVTADRMGEHFNIFSISGESHRK
jgi:hypothetical protein